MKRLPALFIKWLSHCFGYKIGMIKIGNGKTNIEGDNEILKYLDISGYVFKKVPFDRLKNNK